ncbi:MAG: extracellular solute-binding protein [Ruminiclostridium sp.]
MNSDEYNMQIKEGNTMKKSFLGKIVSTFIAAAMTVTLFSGCNSATESEDKETISVYLWTTALYEKYAPYIQSQLPDVNIQFIVGNNDLDFYRFMNENGALPDIITCCRFSLHDASPLKDSLMDLSTTSEAGAVYDNYITSFTNEDGSVNWLPVCADVHGFTTNRALFEKYNIPLPMDYDSFVYACEEFEKVGIRGYAADYVYDYTCMEVLQGLSIPQLTSVEGSMWRTAYSDPASTERVGLDNTVWPTAFERMEKFIKDVNLTPDVLELAYDSVIKMFKNGEAAMIGGTTGYVLAFQEQGMDVVLLPYFGQNGEQWLMTTPNFQVSLNRSLENDEARLKKAMKVLDVMLSEEGQTVLANGQNVLSYSRDVEMYLTDNLSNLKPIIEQNHMYIRIASNDFFSISKDVVSKMIAGEYNAQQAYEAFDSQLRQPGENTAETVFTSEKAYSNTVHSKGGSEAYSVMANTLRSIFGSDVLIATGNSFTGSVLKADYTAKLAGNMIMPNSLLSFHRDMTGSELKETVKDYVEGNTIGFKPFNRGSLPVASGISVEVKKDEDKYTLVKVLKDGKEIKDDDTFSVTCLATYAHFAPVLEDESRTFTQDDDNVKGIWSAKVNEGNFTLCEPTGYITVI